MATIARKAFGTLLKIGDGGGSEVFTTIAEVKDISGAGLNSDTVEVTAHDTGPYKQYITTLIDQGEITFELNFNKGATQGFTGGLYNDQVNGTLRNFQLVLPTSVAATGTLAAYVTSFVLGSPVAGVLSASITLRPNGGIVWT